MLDLRKTLLVALGLALLATPGLAADLELSQDEVQEALQAGQELAAKRSSGYQVEDWVLYDVKDPFTIERGQGEVEAVIVGTPFERLRYRSYLEAYQGSDFGLEQARQAADELANTVTFVVFAHAPSAGEAEQDFLERFGEATLELSGTSLSTGVTDTFGPAQDFYNVPGGTEFRWLGTVSYRFDLSGLAAKDAGSLSGTLSFSDSSGQRYSYDVDLSDYR